MTEQEKISKGTKLVELTGEDLQRLLGLMKSADSVEFKLTIPEPEQRSTATTLGLDPLDAQIRQVYFFDTPDLALNLHGLVVRARRVQGKTADSVVKLRPVVPDELPPDIRASKSVGIEIDAMPGGYVCSAAMKQVITNEDVKLAVMGKMPLRKLFSKEQRAFFTAHAPAGIELDELAVLGPIFVLKLAFSPKELGRRFVAEFWLYPDFSHILELSTKCAPAEAFQILAESKAFFETQGVNISGEQQTKTHMALEFFSRKLEAGATVLA